MADWTIQGPLRLYAPAKINLGLEVLGRRPDGYHDVVTLMESISIFDVIDILPSSERCITLSSDIPNGDDLTSRAMDLLAKETGNQLCLDVTVRKSIPVSAGLGGGSSDAGTVIHALGRLLGLQGDSMQRLAASLGSDIPFFLAGGLAIATGTGTDIVKVNSPSRRWYVIVVPELVIPGKTKTLYQSLQRDDFTDGHKTAVIRDQIEAGRPIDQDLLTNTFQRSLLEYPDFAGAVAALEQAGAESVIASGAGPAVFSVFNSFFSASAFFERLRLPPSTHRFIATSIGPGINSERLRQSARQTGTE
jgi:4-diphosphocytidyl-2-C-methyl-D-erythritol kinase